MKISNITVSPFTIPLVRPWQSSKGEWAKRCGWYIHIKTTDGQVCVGEAAPFPEAGTENMDQCQQALNILQEKLGGQIIETALAELNTLCPNTPAARCGFETALVNLCANAAGLPLSQWINRQAASKVAINANVGALYNTNADQIKQLRDEGYSVVKMKVGLGPIKEEIEHLKALCANIPDSLLLRLDGNACWTMGEAEVFLNEICHLPIECVEEPLRQPDLEKLIKLQRQVPFAIALDENVNQFSPSHELFQSGLKRLILKPMAMGGPLSTFNFARDAQQNGIESIITTTIDTEIATTMARHCAAALDEKARFAHGLGTLDLLDIPQPEELRIKQGYINL